MFEINGKFTTAKVMIDDVEPDCVSQIVSMVNNEVFSNPVAIMPDTHAGKGSVIGFTMEVSDRIIPNIVGVDIGCGMLSVNIGQYHDYDKLLIDTKIRNRVPFGYNVRAQSDIRMKNIREHFMKWNDFVATCNCVGMDISYAIRSIGTLGGGNHFIEIGRDDESNLWVTIHTGSRNFGKKVCEFWQKVATDRAYRGGEKIEDGIERIKRDFPKKEWNNKIKDLKNDIKCKSIRATGLESLSGVDKDGYLRDMRIAQEYSKWNRHVIMQEILAVLGMPTELERIETIHNFIDPVDNIIRKGAIRSYIGEKSVIPFDMSTGLLICEGKSNPEWNFSAPHGAGRVYSRSRAKKELDIDEFRDRMVHVFSTSVNKNTLDESPMAYKDPKIIEEAISDTVTVLKRVKPIHNLKDSEGDRDE